MVTIARERIDVLMVQALKMVRSGDMEKAARYASLARGIGMRYNVRMKAEHRQLLCRSCGALLVPSRTARVRVRHGRRIVTCLKCDAVSRHPIRSSIPPSDRTDRHHTGLDHDGQDDVPDDDGD